MTPAREASIAAVIGELDREREGLIDALAAEALPAIDAQIEALIYLCALDAKVNSPHIDNFLEAVRLEAIHQRERWGTEHDAGKTAAEWFWLIGHLASKALMSATRGEMEKALHHVITSAAALLNWHASLSGDDTRMRPGIEAPAGERD